MRGKGSIGLLLLPLAYYAGAKLSLAFAVTPEVLVLLWIPNSIVLATVLHFGARRYGAIALLVLGAEIAADWSMFPLIEGALFGLINVLEVTVAWLLLRRWQFDSRFSSPADLAKFVIAGPGLAAFTSATAAALLYRYYDGGEFGTYFSVWWFSDALGLLVIAPLALGLWPVLPPLREERIAIRWFDFVALAVAIALIVPFAFAHQRHFYGITVRSFVLIPPALYCAARFGVKITTSVVAIIAGVVLFVTKSGHQPFGDIPVRDTINSAQELIVIISTMSLGIAALLAQHRRYAFELEERVSERTAELIEANQRLHQLATTDALTGLFNRRALLDVLKQELGRQRRYARPLALILFDIDHFKAVNDTYGHAAGDVVLQHVAAVASSVIRNSDRLGRYGGEEFLVIAPETDEGNARQLAERVRMSLRSNEIAVSDSVRLRIAASFGVTMMQPDDTPDEILRRADEALYAAKAAGRDRVALSA